MKYISILKEGINTVHRNWQLILVQLIAMLGSCISFFIIVGIPIAFAFIMLGLDLTEILKFEDAAYLLNKSFNLLNKYFGIAIFLLTSILLYFSFAFLLLVFTISGTIGIITNSLLDINYRFTIPAFFSEGRKRFFPVFGFLLIIGAIFMLIAFFLGILGGGSSAIIEKAKAQEATLALFLGVFFSLILISIGLASILATISITIYGFAYMAFNKSRPLDTLKGTIRYLYTCPSSIGFYSILMLGYIATSFLVILIGAPFTLIPLIGPLLSLPYQAVTYTIQGYIGLIMLSSAFHYYYKTDGCSQAPLSSLDLSTSHAAGDEKSPAPEQIDESQQG